MIKIYDLSKAPYSFKHASYGGLNGSKDGIIIHGEEWMVKYPQNLSNIRGEVPSYSTSPLSEYLGSHIYETLGYDVHKTILGIRNDKLVVACKDFAVEGKMLLEIRTIKNSYNRELDDILLSNRIPSTDSHIVDIDELMIHLDKNSVLSSIPGLKQRFFEQAIVDIFIANTDRNNGNWGIIREKNNPDIIAPVFDNGNSFLPKASDDKIERLSQGVEMINNSTNILTAYGKGGHHFSAKVFLEYFEKDHCFQDAIFKTVSLIQNKRNDILRLIEEIPERAVLGNGKDISVMSRARKEYYIKQMDIRIERLLKPEKERVLKLRERERGKN